MGPMGLIKHLQTKKQIHEAPTISCSFLSPLNSEQSEPILATISISMKV